MTYQSRYNGKKIWSRLSTFFVISISLTACGALPPYQPPGNGAKAKLIIRDRIEPGEVAVINAFTDAVNCKAPARIGVDGGTGTIPTVDISATGLFTVQAFFIKPNRQYCNVLISFQPKDGMRYVLLARSDPSRCSAVLLNGANPDNLVREPTAIARNRRAAYGCIPLDEARAEQAAKGNPDSDEDFPLVHSQPARQAESQDTDSLADFKDLLHKK